MAGRFNTYQPKEFIRLPFEDISKALAMKEQQYEQGYLATPKYQMEMGKQDVRDVDQPYKQKLINDAVQKAQDLTNTVYGGDYGAAALHITKTLADEANNPFWSWNKNAVKDWEDAKKIKQQLQAEGKYLGFNEDIFNKKYYDEKTGSYNTNISHDLQKELDYQKQKQDIWNYAIQEEGGSSKTSLKDAESQAKLGRIFMELKKTGWQGVSDKQIHSKFAGAMADYMETPEYKQEKRKYQMLGMSELQADTKIADDMLKIGRLKEHIITRDDSQIINNPIPKSLNTDKSPSPFDTSIPPKNIQEAREKDTKKVETYRNDIKNIFKETAYTAITGKPVTDGYVKHKHDLSLRENYMKEQLNATKNNPYSTPESIRQAQANYDRAHNDYMYIDLNYNNNKPVESKEIENTYKKATLNDFKSPDKLFLIKNNLDEDGYALFNKYIQQNKGNKSFDEFLNEAADIKENKEVALTNLYYYNSKDLEDSMVEALNAVTGNGVKVKTYITNKDGETKQGSDVDFNSVKDHAKNSLKASQEKGSGKSEVTFLNNAKAGTLDIRIGNTTYSVDKNSLPAVIKNPLDGMQKVTSIYNSYSIKDKKINTGPQDVTIPGANNIVYVAHIEPGVENVTFDAYDMSGNKIGEGKTNIGKIMDSYNAQILSTGLNQDNLSVSLEKEKKQK